MKLITLNLRHDVDRWPERLPLVVDLLRREAADVIALQEVALDVQQAEVIADHLNDGQHTYAVFTAPKWGDAPREGIGFLSRLPVLAYEHVNLPEGCRIGQRIRVLLDGVPVDIANVHLHHRPRHEESVRFPQMQALMAWMRSRSRGGWLLAGDFNALPDSSTVQAARAWLDSAHGTIHGTEPVTHPTPLNPEREPGLSLAIDYILFDPLYLRVVNAYRVADKPHPDDSTLFPSDHYGVAAEFALG